MPGTMEIKWVVTQEGRYDDIDISHKTHKVAMTQLKKKYYVHTRIRNVSGETSCAAADCSKCAGQLVYLSACLWSVVCGRNPTIQPEVRQASFAYQATHLSYMFSVQGSGCSRCTFLANSICASTRPDVPVIYRTPHSSHRPYTYHTRSRNVAAENSTTWRHRPLSIFTPNLHYRAFTAESHRCLRARLRGRPSSYFSLPPGHLTEQKKPLLNITVITGWRHTLMGPRWTIDAHGNYNTL